MITACTQCGGEFRIRPYKLQRNKTGVFCSRACQYDAKRCSRKNDEKEFWSRVDRTAGAEGCWPWLAGLYSLRGYGYFQYGRKRYYAHRMALRFSGVDVPNDKYVIHSCDYPSCCNPAHLRVGTHADNMRDMVERGRSLKGSRNGHAKLVENQVRSIKGRHPNVQHLEEIASEFCVSVKAIKDILSGRRWVHVT